MNNSSHGGSGIYVKDILNVISKVLGSCIVSVDKQVEISAISLDTIYCCIISMYRPAQGDFSFYLYQLLFQNYSFSPRRIILTN